MLYFSSNWLVDSAKRLALILGVSPFVIGLTIVAFGSSAPEAALALMSDKSPDVVLGNIVGSNIANIGLVIGISALVYPLATRFDTVRFEVWVMLAATALFTVMAYNRQMEVFEGIILLLIMALFIYVVYRFSRQDPMREIADEVLRSEDDSRLSTNLLITIVSLGLLVIGARFFVIGAVEFASFMGVSELVVGLVVVAIGTSLPELSISLVAAIKKETEIILSNIIGSNIFNSLFVMGLAAVNSPIMVPMHMMSLEFPLMLVLSIMLLLAIRFRGGVGRKFGLVFVFIYFAYLTILFI